MTLRTLRHRIRSVSERSRRYSERHFNVFGIIAVFAIPLTTVVEQVVGDPSFNTLYIRLFASAAGLLLLFHDKLPSILSENMDLVWVYTATFILPFCFGLILTFNAALAEPSSSPSPVWIYQYLVALFIFIQLINHGPWSVALWLAATLLVFGLCFILTEPNYRALREVWLYPLPVYLTVLIVGSITNRNVHVVQTEQLRAASAIGSNIAHELRTPLASIRLMARSIGRHLPELVEGYRTSRLSGHLAGTISEKQLQALDSGLESIQAEVDYSNTIIDMLLLNTSDHPTTLHQVQYFRISEAVREAMSRFPFNNSAERQLINCSLGNDFLVYGSRLLLVHVFFNLIKNGICFVQKGRRGVLEISTHSRNRRNIVEVTDTGEGIPESIRSQIFDRFFSATDSGQGAGIGLSFCKMVMESIGGEIQCESKEGEFTTFRLIFPDAPEEEPPKPDL